MPQELAQSEIYSPEYEIFSRIAVSSKTAAIATIQQLVLLNFRE